MTDYSGEYGGIPTVAYSLNKVHVSYNKGGYPKTRDYDYQTSNWEDPQLVYNGSSSVERAFVTGDTLHLFYYRTVCDMGECIAYMTETKRAVGSTSWSSPVQLDSYSDPYHPVSVTGTSDGKINITYPNNGLQYRYYSGGAWSSTQLISGSGANIFGHIISSVSNDLFVVWSEGSYFKYRQYDAAPTVPQNVTIAGSVGQHPTVSWSANPEPDLAGYKIYRKVTPDESQFSLVATTSQTSWTDAYVTIRTGGTGGQYAYYYVKAYDASSNLSDASSTVYKPITNYNPPRVNDGQGGLPKILPTPKEFAVDQNYPNPFNPSTQITFAVPEPAHVKVVVLDLLGREIAILMDRSLSPCYQTVQWRGTDASSNSLGSGVFFCRVTAQGVSGRQFVKTIKMIVMR